MAETLEIPALHYRIFLTENLENDLSGFFYKKKDVYTQKIILADENTAKYCLPILLDQVPSLNDAATIIIPEGEKSKSLEEISVIWKKLFESGADRSSLLINLGGGCLTDVGAFAAGTFMRGISFISIPTSLMAMVDASIGGKNGINFNGIKNLVGTLKLPSGIFIHPIFLKTLPQREINCGFAEMIKHALLEGTLQWNAIKAMKELNPENISPFISDSVFFKNKIVNEDYHETGLRQILNLGHTIGHALESYSAAHHQNPLKHGEAIAAGLVAEIFLSQKLFGFNTQVANELIDLVNLHFQFSEKIVAEELLPLMMGDKKKISGEIKFVLMKKLGEPVLKASVNKELIIESLNFMQQVLKF